jgi:hypothetical protein
MENLEVLFELKYCERCGALWVRPLGMEEVYCAACVAETTGGSPLKRLRKPRLTLNHSIDTRIEEAGLAERCTEGGNA